MPKLTDTQLIILSAAAQRQDGAILPLPKSVKTNKAAVTRTIRGLITRGLISERPATRNDEAWREAEDGGRVALVITDAGLAAVGADTNDRRKPRHAAAKTQRNKRKPRSRRSAPDLRTSADAAPPKVRQGTKQAQMIDLMKRKDGATIDDIVDAIGWQPHSVRGAISGALKKKLGLAVENEVVENRGRVYRIAGRQNGR